MMLIAKWNSITMGMPNCGRDRLNKRRAHHTAMRPGIHSGQVDVTVNGHGVRPRTRGTGRSDVIVPGWWVGAGGWLRKDKGNAPAPLPARGR